MPITIATWNINSVRLRRGLVAKFLTDEAPDLLCLQETKSPVEKIPVDEFEPLGYRLVTARGFKGYNGVAIFSRVDAEAETHWEVCGQDDARHCATGFLCRRSDGGAVRGRHPSQLGNQRC